MCVTWWNLLCFCSSESTTSEPKKTPPVDVTSDPVVEDNQSSQGFGFNESGLGLSQQEETMLTKLLNDSVTDNAVPSPGKGNVGY